MQRFKAFPSILTSPGPALGLTRANGAANGPTGSHALLVVPMASESVILKKVRDANELSRSQVK